MPEAITSIYRVIGQTVPKSILFLPRDTATAVPPLSGV